MHSNRKAHEFIPHAKVSRLASGKFSHPVGVVKKKPPEFLQNGDIPKKYHHLWYMKKVGSLSDAAMEVIAQELFRLILPTHPKTRVVYNDDASNFYVISMQVPDFKGMHLFHRRDLNAAIKGGALHGFGGVIVGALWLDEMDLKAANVGADENDNIVKIDGGQCFTNLRNFTKRVHRYDLSRFDLNQLPFLPGLHAYNWFDDIAGAEFVENPVLLDEEMKQNQYFRREVNAALMKIVLLPDVLLERFIHSYLPGSGNLSHELMNEIISRRNDLREAACKNASFHQYIASEDAQSDLDEYLAYLRTFTTKNKHQLIHPDSTIIADMMRGFVNLRKTVADIPLTVTLGARKKITMLVNEYINSMAVYAGNDEKRLNWSVAKTQNHEHAKQRVNAMINLMAIAANEDDVNGYDSIHEQLAKMIRFDAVIKAESKHCEKFFEAGKFSRCINAVKTILEDDLDKQQEYQRSLRN